MKSASPSEYLSHFLPVRMVAIHKGRDDTTWQDFTAADPALEWGEEKNQAGYDIYYTVNQLWRETAPGSRGGSPDIGMLRAIPFDFDPKTGDWKAAQPDLDAISSVLDCSFEIHSGRGRQCILLLKEPISTQDEDKDSPPSEDSIKDHTRPGRAMLADWKKQLELHETVTIDNTVDLPRIMRCPGFINHKTGQRARVVRDTGKRFDFSEMMPEVDIVEISPDYKVDVDLGLLPLVVVDELNVTDTVKGIIKNGVDPADKEKHGSSRNEWAMEIAGGMARGGHTAEEIASVFLNTDNGISDWAYFTNPADGHSKRRKDHRERAILRTIEKAFRDEAVDQLKQKGEIFLCPASPLESARIFAAVRPPLTHVGKTWYEFHVASYRDIEEDTLRAEVWGFCGAAKMQGKHGEVMDFNPNRKVVGDIIEAIQSLVHHDARRLKPGQWIRNELFPRLELLPLRNGLLHLPTKVLHDPTPDLFIVGHRDFNYDPDATCPTWDWFLAENLNGDLDQICLLQEDFGYHLTPDTRFQKAFNYYGGRRGGKGTAMKIKANLVGGERSDWKDSSGLDETFGMESFLTADAAFFDDVRSTFGPKFTENFLAMTGGSPRNVKRKGIGEVKGDLGVKFTFTSNTLLTFSDKTGIAASRLLNFDFPNDYFGREDLTLEARIKEEMSGILNWSLPGYDRIHAQGHFSVTKQSDDITAQMEEATSQLIAFQRDKLILKVNGVITEDVLWDMWQTWCDGQNNHHRGTKREFISDLKSAIPDIAKGETKTTIETHDGPKQVRCCKGIAVKGQDGDDDDIPF